MTAQDYYKILGIPESAGETEIKKAYRKLAMEYHPDHNPNDPRAEEKFRKITEAYGVLMDPAKRREYDRFRSYAGTGASSQFRYSQQDIFENMFRQAFGRDIFEELNKEFSRYGYRSGSSFFEAVFFGGVAGSLGKLLTLIPGPLGKLGYALRLVQMIGSSALVFSRMLKNTGAPATEGKPWLNSIQEVFGLAKNPEEENLNIELSISISPEEAHHGAKKKISYNADGTTEKLQITIPPGIASGGKLRIKEKGSQKNSRRGDLILQVEVKPNG